MASENIETGSIGPQLSLDDVTLPPAVGERFGALYGADERLETAADWIDLTRSALADAHDTAPTVADLCTSPDGAHTFVGAESQSYVCVLDPLAYPFIVDETGTVRSETPLHGDEVVFEIDADGVTVTPEDAVVSVGVSDHVDAVGEVTVETIYRQVCGYIHAFTDEAEYEQWAGDVEAATTPLPAEEGVAVAREIAVSLFDADA